MGSQLERPHPESGALTPRAESGRVRRAVLSGVLALVALLALLIAAAGSRGDDEEVTPMRRLSAGMTSGHYQTQGRTIHYVESGDAQNPLVLFVHGSPGDWSAFDSYLVEAELLRRFHMISVDRPGFGSSGFGHYVTSLREQAALLSPLLERAGSAGALLVGHSLGGSVIARMAMDYPLRVAGLLLVAPAIDPALEELRWYNRLASLSMVRLILPQALDASNQEILPLKAELEKMLPLWSQVQIPTIVIQGLQDRLVSPGNADFAEKVLGNAPLRVERVTSAGHFILWERPNLIKRTLLELAAAADQMARPSGP